MRTLLLSLSLAGLLTPAALAADTPGKSTSQERLEAVANQLTAQSYKLRYRFTPGEIVRWKVTHLVTVETKIQGVTQAAKTRSVSTKAWTILDADPAGKIRFQHAVENVDMWQGVSGRQDVRYNSTSDAKPPAEYAHVANAVGKPLVTVSIDSAGKLLEPPKRNEEVPHFNPGLGDLTVPLPDGPVKIGGQWETPEELTLRLEDGQVEKIKTRQLYTLQAVEAGVATIKVETQVLTPSDDPKIKVKLVQRLTNGSFKFDLDAGRITSKQMDLDELVLGFQGNDSSMAYRARFTEELVPGTFETAIKTTAEPAPSVASGSPIASSKASVAKARDGKPVLRR